MNSTKSNLVKASAILAIISGISSLLSFIFEICDFGYVGETLTGSGYFDGQTTRAIVIAILVFDLVLGLCSLAGGVMLLKWRKQNSMSSSTLYKVGCGLVIAGGLGLGLQSILLYIAFASNGQRFDPEFHEDTLNENGEHATYVQTSSRHESDSIERQIKLLREMKERGEISDDEFKQMMFDLIRNQK